MGAFVISYVPNVENVDNIERVKDVERVDLVNKVNQVDNVSNVEKVQDVMTVHDVRKLPHPHFPLLPYNYQYGGKIEVTNSTNVFQATFLPETNCEFKGIHLCCTAYNVEDTYDVMIGNRYIIQNSHVKEMAEYRMLENYEPVSAGTPVTIVFHNNSGTEKSVLYDMINLVETEGHTFPGELTWTFDWSDPTLELNEQDTLTLIINPPPVIDTNTSSIKKFTLDIIDLDTQLKVATIWTYNVGDGIQTTIYSDYVEDDPLYQGLGFLARVNVMAITSMSNNLSNIQVLIKNINDTGTVDPYPIRLGIKGTVENTSAGV